MEANEIVNGLRMMAKEACVIGKCGCCPIKQYNTTGDACDDFIMTQAANLIEHLQSQLAAEVAKCEESQRRERAAVEDILDAALTPCTYCEGNPTNEGICDMQNDHHNMFGCWQWRGLQEAGK